jgi:geranylgeranyl diphosphate synthase type II
MLTAPRGRARAFAPPPPAPPAARAAWTRFSAAVDAVIDGELEAARNRPGLASPRFARLLDGLAQSLRGGKRTRPYLVHIAFTGCGGGEPHRAVQLAAALELLHGALLLHDDVIDRDFVRRGAPTLGARYRSAASDLGHDDDVAEHAGHSASLIAGDLLLSGAVRLAAEAGAGSPHGAAVLDAVHGAVLAAAAGELDDLLFSLDPASTPVDGVLNMERLKTAAYSFEAPLQAGALLAGAPASTAHGLGALGRNIGTAYQVIDDVLGTFGDPGKTGKSIDSDLRSGKKTVLTSYAAGDPGFRAELRRYRAGHCGIDALRAALKASGAEEYARRLAADLVDSALRNAGALPLEPQLLEELTALCGHVVNRAA